MTKHHDFDLEQQKKQETQEAIEAQEELRLNMGDSELGFQFYKKAVMFGIQRLLRDKLTQVASSLTFTTVLAIVPMLAVILSLFTAFPLFTDFKVSLEEFLTHNLMPETVSETIMSYLNMFAQQASKLTAIGVGFLIVTSIMLMMTIDEVLNDIWNVTRRRPIGQRILVYWAILSLGPIFLGASLWTSSYIAQEQLGLVTQFSVIKSVLFTLVPVIVSGLIFALLYYLVPNRKVAWKDAMIGGYTTAILLEIMKAAFAYYITQFPSYTLIYGAFATIPIFLLWIYLSWLVVLFGATVAALAPQIRSGQMHDKMSPGVHFVTALFVLRLLHSARDRNPPGYGTSYIAGQIKMNYSETLDILEPLVSLGYIVNTAGKRSERWVLASSLSASLDPLADCFLFDSKVIEISHDPALRQVIARLMTEDNTVKLRDILYLDEADSGSATPPIADTDTDDGKTAAVLAAATNTTVNAP
ncbi:YihY family inner membrane protein [Advenella sp. S44]|uniref:YihY family inner membrane protein n=1 Tax=Advenella sp. S44 TaxID=1982755 RepID=UPI001F5BE776|nr:YihY family inner membrane protein [Advenella sp. S44]